MALQAPFPSGCGGGNYCPSDPVTRGQMAVFISATWGYSTPVPTSTRRHFLYDRDMHLIAESELTSAFEPGVAYEYIWLGDGQTSARHVRWKRGLQATGEVGSSQQVLGEDDAG